MSDEIGSRLEGITTSWTVIRDAHGSADVLFQEFGVALVEGKLKGADPGGGRFRDYVKAVLRHLVAKYYGKRKRGPQAVGGETPALDDVPAPEPADDARFNRAWGESLLACARAALDAANPTGYAVLRFRADHPELSSPDLAAGLSAQLGKPLTAEGVHQTLRRARKQFALLPAEEVGRSLDRPTPDAVREELAELGLPEYCRPALGG